MSKPSHNLSADKTEPNRHNTQQARSRLLPHHASLPTVQQRTVSFFFFFIQVTKVERLENPEVWRGYNRKREELFHKLKSPLGSTACCTSVESLSSRGQVKTTINVNKAGALCREIYAQVRGSESHRHKNTGLICRQLTI